MLESLNAYKIVIVILNIILFYVLMKKFLFRPVTEFMENRTKSIKDSIDNAEKVRIEATELKAKYENQLASAKATGDRIIEEARIKAEKESEKIINAAKLESENILKKAREEIGRERDQALKEVRNQVASLALAAASKIIEANMDNESNRALVDRFIDKAGAA